MFQKIKNIFKKLHMLNNEEGSILLISYFMIVVLVGIGVAFLQLVTSETRVSERQRLATVAFHVAEAGIERGLYDLRQDFVNSSIPSWADGDINSHMIGPDDLNFYSFGYSGNTINGGTYTVELQNVSGEDDIWVRSTGSISGASHTILVYVRMVDISPWNNAIFAGAGASGTMVNGNVDIRGSVHILGTGLNPGDFAIDLGGTAELVGNNYNGLNATLEAKVPPLPTTSVNGETVETLGAELRVKYGKVGLSGSSTVGEADQFGNSEKETVDGAYVTDGYGGNSGSASVHSDNGTSNGYDLGDAVQFPSLSSPYGGYSNYKAYLQSLGAYTVTSTTELGELESITPNSSFTIGDGGTNYITMDGAGNMTVSGIVVLDQDLVAGFDGNFVTNKAGPNKTINYTGTGTLYASGSVHINTSLVTTGNNSFPTNILGVMTPNSANFNETQIDVMGVFYAENSVTVQKQTDIIGTIVSNYFDMGINVPAIYQVPETINSMPPGMIGENSKWYLVVAWIKS